MKKWWKRIKKNKPLINKRNSEKLKDVESYQGAVKQSKVEIKTEFSEASQEENSRVDEIEKKSKNTPITCSLWNSSCQTGMMRIIRVLLLYL